MVQGQACRVNAAALSVHNVWWPLWCTHLCPVYCCHGGGTFQNYLVGWTWGQGFRLLMVWVQWLEFIIVLQGKKFTKTTPLSSQNITTMSFPVDGALLNFFILRNVVWSFHWLLRGFGFQVVDSGFIPHDSLWQEALTSSIILVQKKSGSCFHCL